MNPKQDALALAAVGALIDPRGWQSAVTATAPVLAVCTVAIVIVLCGTVVILVTSTEPSQRLAAIKALVAVLLALTAHQLAKRVAQTVVREGRQCPRRRTPRRPPPSP